MKKRRRRGIGRKFRRRAARFPDGSWTSWEDLPKKHERWSVRSRKNFVLLFESGKISKKELRVVFRMSAEEYLQWRSNFLVRQGKQDISLKEDADLHSLKPNHLMQCGMMKLLFRPFGGPSIAAVYNRWLSLSELQMHCLEILMRRSGTVVTPDMFLSFVYPKVEAEPHSKIFHVIISLLRKKLEKVAPGEGWEYIDAFPGRGYCIDEARAVHDLTNHL